MKENINSLDEMLLLCESPVHNIARGLREKGYGIAGHLGIRQKQPTCNVVGVLKEREPIQKNFYGIKWTKSQRAFYIGRLWINNKEKKAKEKENWVLEVYGREYLAGLTKDVKNISSSYKVKVQAKLISDYPEEEVYLSEM